MRDIETIDAELRLVAALRRAAPERGGPLPSITVRMRCWVSLDDPVVFGIDSVRMSG
jgi:hypothetical protein